MSAIDQRKDAATTDETTDAFTVEESQTISGRVVIVDCFVLLRVDGENASVVIG